MERGAKAAATTGVAAAAAILGYTAVDRWRRRVDRRATLGSLRGGVHTVTTPDGVDLHVEVDEGVADGPVLVFVHGLAMTQDSWHYQRAHFRGRRRPMVFLDQRSHGRSGESHLDHLSIEQMGVDLGQVIDEVVPDDRNVVLVGHSMGGMTIMALAEARPEFFGDRVAGVALVATSAGEMDTHRVVLPFLPEPVGLRAREPAKAGLRRLAPAIDGTRRRLPATTFAGARLVAFGRRGTADMVGLVTRDLGAASAEVVLDLAAEFDDHDRYEAVQLLGHVPTTIISGTWDVIIRHRHARDLHERIAGSRLVELPRVGHCPMIERHGEVNVVLEELLDEVSRRSRSTR